MVHVNSFGYFSSVYVEIFHLIIITFFTEAVNILILMWILFLDDSTV